MVCELAIVIVIGGEVALPAASRCSREQRCGPSATVVLSQPMLHEPYHPRQRGSLPSRRNCTPVTPTLSLASAVTVTVPVSVEPAPVR